MSGHYIEPLTLDDAVTKLSEHAGARCLAGGQTLIAMMNAGLIAPPTLIALRRIAELGQLTVETDGAVSIGAMVTHARLAGEAKLTGAHALLRQAAAVVAHPAIRNLGTIGGALSHADPNADYPAAVVAAGAQIELVGPAGRRWVPASTFFLDFLTAAIEPGEIVTRLRLPPAPADAVGVYEKFARVDGDYATASIAIVLRMEAAVCADIRVAVGSCGPTPIRVPEAEHGLIGNSLDAAALAQAGALIAAALDPVDDVRGSAAYRRMLVPRLLARAVSRALSLGEPAR